MLYDWKSKQIWNRFPGRLIFGFLRDDSHFNWSNRNTPTVNIHATNNDIYYFLLFRVRIPVLTSNDWNHFYFGKARDYSWKKHNKSGYCPRKFKLRFNGLSLLFNFSQTDYTPVAFYLLFFSFHPLLCISVFLSGNTPS